MGKQCYYYGVDKNQEKLTELIIEKIIKEEKMVGYYGKVTFKKPIQAEPYMWDKKESPEYLHWNENEVFFVIQGNRYETNRFTAKLTGALDVLNISNRIIPLDNINTDLYINDFRNYCKQNESKIDFENDYVIITR